MPHWLELFTVVVTNLSFLPIIYLSYKFKMKVEMIVFAGAFFTSIFYHFAESLNHRTFLGI